MASLPRRLLLISAAGGSALSLSFFKSHVYLKPDFKMLSSALKPDFFFLLRILKPHLGSHSSQRGSFAADLSGSVGQPVSETEPPPLLSSTVAFGQLADVFLSEQSRVVPTQPEHGAPLRPLDVLGSQTCEKWCAISGGEHDPHDARCSQEMGVWNHPPRLPV